MTEFSPCNELHEVVQHLRRTSMTERFEGIPTNGIYFLFENNEIGHGGKRITQIGGHTGAGKLAARLAEHIKPNKDRSILRKNIGRALLNRDQDPFLDLWNLDLTPRAQREKNAHRVSQSKLGEIEDRVSKHIADTFSFAVIECASLKDALRLKKLAIGSVSQCSTCSPSESWLGTFSPKEKIRRSGLWQEIGLFKAPLQPHDLLVLRK